MQAKRLTYTKERIAKLDREIEEERKAIIDKYNTDSGNKPFDDSQSDPATDDRVDSEDRLDTDSKVFKKVILTKDVYIMIILMSQRP